MSNVRVMYVGKKPRQTDTVGGTKTVWNGPGDVQEVPLSAWAKMTKHPDVWSLDDGSRKAVDVVLAAAGLDASAAEQVKGTLAGLAGIEPVLDSALPEILQISDGVTMPRDEVVRGAFQALVFGAKEWNELSAEDRAELVDAHIDRMRPRIPVETSDAPTADFKAADTPAQSTKVDLKALDKAALQALAAEKGVKVHHNAGEDKLRAALEEAGV